MLRRFLFAIVILVFFGEAVSTAEAGISIVGGDQNHDFGEVARNKPLKYELTIRNDGDRPVSIKESQTSCGACSPVRFGSATVAPGGDVEATIRVNSSNKKGIHTQHFIVQASDGVSTSTLELSVSWTVKAFLECIPESIDLGAKIYSTTQDYEVTLDAQGLTSPVQFTSVTCPSPHVRIHGVEERGPNRVIYVSVLPTIPVGDFETSITLTTDYEKEPVIYVPIRGKIAGPFHVDQRYVNFGAVPAGKEVERQVAIQRRVPTERITGAECDESILDCQLDLQGRAYTLTVKSQPTLAAGMHRTTIRLRTTCAQQPLIELPVILQVR
jgi:hypothetical protein